MQGKRAGLGWGKRPPVLERVSIAEAPKSSCGTAAGHFLEAGTPSTEFSGFFHSLAGDDYPGANEIASPAETAGFRPHLEGHAYFSAHSPPGKPERPSAHLFITHADAESAEDTSLVLHRKPDLEDTHAGGNVLG